MYYQAFNESLPSAISKNQNKVIIVKRTLQNKIIEYRNRCELINSKSRNVQSRIIQRTTYITDNFQTKIASRDKILININNWSYRSINNCQSNSHDSMII